MKIAENTWNECKEFHFGCKFEMPIRHLSGDVRVKSCWRTHGVSWHWMEPQKVQM